MWVMRISTPPRDHYTLMGIAIRISDLQRDNNFIVPHHLGMKLDSVNTVLWLTYEVKPV